jgi:hydroxyethylthiazole kinase
MMNGTSVAAMLSRVRENRPLIHHITNNVTINDCANITLCAGAAPVMAESDHEVAEMVTMAGALVLNIGTLSSVQVDAMLIAGQKANELGIPVILDPVGAGATSYRTGTTLRLLASLKISVLKGNAGEIGVIAGSGGKVRGVDSAGLTGDPVETARKCALTTGCTVAMTGPDDIITDGRRVFVVKNGHPMMDRLSGTGCMAASVTGAFAAVSDDYTESSAAALAVFGRAGEIASGKAEGPYSFRTALFDSLASIAAADIASHTRITEL